MLPTLVAENMLDKVKWTTKIFILSNISAMCTELTKTCAIMIGSRQFLYMCKADKTKLNDRFAIGGSVLNILLQTKYKR